MKILEPGKNKDNWSIQHRCTGWGNVGVGCDALLELEFDDLRYFPGVPGDSRGSRDPAVTFKCPCCSMLTDIGINDWPKDYRNLPIYQSSRGWIEEKTVDNLTQTT